MKKLKFYVFWMMGFLLIWCSALFLPVFGKNPITSLEFSPLIVKRCDNVTFTCQIDGLDFEIWWTLNGTKLNESPNITLTEENTILEITCAHLTHNGNYSCHVQENNRANSTNITEEYSKSVNFRIAERLGIKNFVGAVKGEIGKIVTLQCTIVGYPVPRSIEWSKNGTSLSSNGNLNITQRVSNVNEISSTLQVHNLTESDLGPYTCRATTTLDFFSTDVTIVNKGLSAPQELEAKIINPTSVKLLWKNLPSEGGLQVNSHQISLNRFKNGESNNTVNNVGTRETGHGATHEYLILNLQEGYNYSVKINACNTYIGCSQSSDEVYFFLYPYSSEPLNVDASCHYDNISLQSYVDVKWSTPEDPKDIIRVYKVHLMGSANYINSRGIHIYGDGFTREVETEKTSVKVQAAANTNYTVQVCAETSVGCGLYSQINLSTSCSTPPSVPSDMPNFVLKKSEPTEECRQFKLDMKPIDQRHGPITCYRIILYKMKFEEEELPVPLSIDISSYDEVHKDGAYGAYIAEAFSGKEKIFKEITLGDNIQSRCDSLPAIRQRRTVDSNFDDHAVFDGELSPETYYSGFVEVKVTGKDDVILTRRSNLFSPVRTGSVKYNLQATALGVICGLLIVIIILIIALCTLSKRNNFMDYERRGQSRFRQIFCGFFNRPRHGGLLGTPVLPIPDIKPLKPENLPSAFIERHKDSDLLFQREFEALPEHFRDRSSKASDMLENFFKNRYPDIKAYDQSRVKLSQIENVAGSDYINANFVMGYKDRKKFICAQGPLDKTVNDFWRMIWEQKVEMIVMVTGLEENCKIKCAKYWPNDGDEKTFGNIRVTVENCDVYADYAVRKLKANYQKDDENNESRIICQFHYLTWKDFLAPEHPGGILKLIKRINEYYSPEMGPILVHCSAGVGRTGTLVVIDSLLQQLKDEGQIDIYNAVASVRRYRNFLVQSLKQYIFLYRALLEYSQFGDTELEIVKLKEIFNGEGDGQQLLTNEFQKLSEIIEDVKMSDIATSDVNVEKNKCPTAVPYDRNRVILSPVPSREHSTYINASFIQGYDRTDTFIITQDPLSSTINEFWRMIEEQCVSLIFNLTSHMELEYWPQDECAYDHIKVKLVKSESHEFFVSREFNVTNEKTSSTQTVVQLQLLCIESNDDAVVSTPDLVISLVKHVWEKKLHVSGPAVVHCTNGANRSSTFIACYILLSQIKNEHRVDVFQIARHMRSQRPQMLQNFIQYEFCYRTAMKFVDSF